MPSLPLENFCRRLCDALGVEPPALQADGEGPTAFSLDYQGVALVVSDAGMGASQAPQAALVVDFGDVPEHEQVDVYAALLQANFMMLGAGGPSFGLHPVSARVTYQIVFGLDQADPVVLCRALEGITEAVLQWRETRLLAPAAAQAGEPPAPASAIRA